MAKKISSIDVCHNITTIDNRRIPTRDNFYLPLMDSFFMYLRLDSEIRFEIRYCFYI